MIKTLCLINIFTTRLLRGVLFQLLFILFFFNTGLTQTIPIGSVFSETLRSMQLMGKLDSSISFTVNPIYSNKQVSVQGIYSFIDNNEASKSDGLILSGKNSMLKLLPVLFNQQLNTDHPYGWNDGAMISAKGYQTLISAGIYASLGPLEVQFQPEMVYAANPAYANNAAYGNNFSKTYNKIFPGQSSIRLSVGAITAGVSSQNLWWGPGIHSSLLMSNNAPGFIHGFFSTRRPVKTAIGSFEWQLIGAKLTSDNNYAYENYNLKTASLPSNARYLNAYVISYQPKWVPGLFLGMTRALQRYRKDIDLSSSFFNKYIPVLTKPFQKANAQGDDTLRTDQLASFFLRWVLLKAKAEFYIEWGYNDYNQNVRDYVMSPTHSAAHIVGFKKITEKRRSLRIDMWK